MRGISGSQLPRTNFSFISEIKVPNPNKSIQNSLNESILNEKNYIIGINKLINIYTQKTQEIINNILGI